jgi:ribosome-binding protein aMBF1 (putative translation factor)
MDKVVYGLRDPRNGKYYYIGMSYCGMERPLSHLLGSTNPKIREWVTKLKKANVVPQIDILERVSEKDDLVKKESSYIRRYSVLNKDMINIVGNLNGRVFRNESTDEEWNQLMNLITEIPKIIKRERSFRNMTQQHLSDEAGISRSTLSLVERGEDVTTGTLHKILNTLQKHMRVVDLEYGRVRSKRDEE